MLLGNNRFAVVDATVSEENANALFPGYDMYAFAIFDNDLTRDKFLISLATPLYVVTFNANGTSEGPYDGKVSDLLLKAGYEDPNILIKCKRNVTQKDKTKPVSTCETRFATIATPSDLVDYDQTKLGLLQSFALTEHLDSWPSIFMRLVTGSIFSCVLFSSGTGRRITWDKTKAMLIVQTKDERLVFDKFSSFCSFINTVQGTVDKVSIETSSYSILIHNIPVTILDLDSIKNSPGIYSYYKFDRHTPLWDQVLSTFFTSQPDDHLLGITKYKGIHIPIYAIASTRVINVPKAWCSTDSTYECLEVKYKEYEGDKVIYLERLSGDGGCASYRRDDIGAGTLLIELAKDLAKYVLQATKLELDDLSSVECKDDKYSSVSLPLVSYLKKQKTWYESKDIIPTENHKYERVKKVLETKMETLAMAVHLLQLEMVQDVDRSLSDEDFLIASLGWNSSLPQSDLQIKLIKFVFNMIFFLELYSSDSFMNVITIQWARDTDNYGASEFWFDNEEEDEPTPGTVRSDAVALTKYIVEPTHLFKMLSLVLIPNSKDITNFGDLINGLQSIGFDDLPTLVSLAEKHGPISASLILFIQTCMKEIQQSNGQSDQFKEMVVQVGQMAKSFREVHGDMLLRIEQYPNKENTMRQYMALLYDEGCKSIFIPMKNFLANDFGYAHLLFFDRFIPSVWDIMSDEKRNDLKRKSSDETMEDQPTPKYGKFDLTPFMMSDD